MAWEEPSPDSSEGIRDRGELRTYVTLCSSRKYIHNLPQKGLEFPGGWGSGRTKNLKKCMKLNWNFQRGVEEGVC